MNEDKEVVGEQDAKLADLKALIEIEQRKYDEQTAELEMAKKVNKYEDDK